MSDQQFVAGDKVSVEGKVLEVSIGARRIKVEFVEGGAYDGWAWVDTRSATLIDRALPTEPGIGALVKISKQGTDLDPDRDQQPFYAQRFTQGWYLGSEREPRTWEEMHDLYDVVTVIEKGWYE